MTAWMTITILNPDFINKIIQLYVNKIEFLIS